MSKLEYAVSTTELSRIDRLKCWILRQILPKQLFIGTTDELRKWEEK